MKIKVKKLSELTHQQPQERGQGEPQRRFVSPASIHLPDIKKLALKGVPVIVYDDVLTSSLIEEYVAMYSEEVK